MIHEKSGDLLESLSEFKVNTVNCVGVMGKGIALDFRKRFPKMFDQYKVDCRYKKVKPGHLTIYCEGDQKIVCFATKDHWMNPSEYPWIESGLLRLREFLKVTPKTTLSLPYLGCGNGGLDKKIVKDLIFKYLGDLEHDIYLYEK